MSSGERDRLLATSRGGANTVVILLLAGILVALVMLIAVLLTQRDGGGDSTGAAKPSAPAVGDGEKATRSDLPKPPEEPEPVAKPDRIRQTLQAGKTYRIVLKAGLDAQVEDKAWGIKEIVNLAYMAEMEIDRAIESNDDRRVVELRHFVTMRNVKLLCDVNVAIDLGTPGTVVLRGLAYFKPGVAGVVVPAKSIVEFILSYGAEAAARSRATKAVALVDTLSGKKVRIAYVDGVGVETIEPVSCWLTAEERDFVFQTAALSDCYIFPDLTVEPGASWDVDGAQFVGLLDPSLRGRPSGRVVIGREADVEQGGKRFASLRIQGGSLALNASDGSTRRVGDFTPAGALRFDLADGYVDRADLTGRFTLESVSTDHILFETSLRSRPTLQIQYSCAIR